MTREDIDDIINAICPNDEDYEKPCISPKYLRQELEQLALDQRQWNGEPTIKNDCAEQNGCISCSLDDGDDCCRKLYEESMQEPTTKNDLALIHTEGLDEEIRCTMCTNCMKSDRGCDGSCVVNKDMYKAVMDAIEKRIQPTTKNDLADDCISRESVLKLIYDYKENHSNDREHYPINYGTLLDMIRWVRNLPSVTPQEPRKGHWKDIPKYKDIAWQCSECEHFTTMKHNYCPKCGAKMVEPQESEGKE